ncbi:hypothetical protein OPQ81_002244 [Rhizoctonia solani]|nr:hypothetical protein OPQ81_002244 [Rhizoctonia solani]
MDTPRSSLLPNPSWTAFRDSPQSLRDSSGRVPALVSTVEGLLHHLDESEGTAKSRAEFESQATRLTELSNSLEQSIQYSESITAMKAVSIIGVFHSSTSGKFMGRTGDVGKHRTRRP